jgi:hypothetical protein
MRVLTDYIHVRSKCGVSRGVGKDVVAIDDVNAPSETSDPCAGLAIHTPFFVSGTSVVFSGRVPADSHVTVNGIATDTESNGDFTRIVHPTKLGENEVTIAVTGKCDTLRKLKVDVER